MLVQSWVKLRLPVVFAGHGNKFNYRKVGLISAWTSCELFLNILLIWNVWYPYIRYTGCMFLLFFRCLLFYLFYLTMLTVTVSTCITVINT